MCFNSSIWRLPRSAPLLKDKYASPVTFNLCNYEIGTPYSAFDTYVCIYKSEPVIETATTGFQCANPSDWRKRPILGGCGFLVVLLLMFMCDNCCFDKPWGEVLAHLSKPPPPRFTKTTIVTHKHQQQDYEKFPHPRIGQFRQTLGLYSGVYSPCMCLST